MWMIFSSKLNKDLVWFAYNIIRIFKLALHFIHSKNENIWFGFGGKMIEKNPNSVPKLI